MPMIVNGLLIVISWFLDFPGRCRLLYDNSWPHWFYWLLSTTIIFIWFYIYNGYWKYYYIELLKLLSGQPVIISWHNGLITSQIITSVVDKNLFFLCGVDCCLLSTNIPVINQFFGVYYWPNLGDKILTRLLEVEVKSCHLCAGGIRG